ncbi:type I polyketide synthase [Pedobacter xixiisoli]|uniref:Acyl transferase domain-containing protein n=1 Tax=Pedobacter xixiisoli TaxID=1476464 RepID=A0A286ACI9_9SPHI|nr:type I polyketide synthase [Pedobacter xixiisoli]SOD19616.1 Acyl transferase domain-containing protein [Pedobacter xixiisoli]
MYRTPTSKTEKDIINIWQQMLLVDKIGVDDNFFEMGGNSLLAQKTVAQLKQLHQKVVPIKVIYQGATAAKIASFIEGKQTKPTLKFAKQDRIAINKDVAIIGMKLRFPGADTLEEFWDNLVQKKETVTFFEKNQLDNSLSPHLTNDKDYVAARGIINDAENFDASFFGISNAMAELMDPQHRVFMELSRDLLESTGYLPAKYDGIIGIYAGCGNNTYFLNNVLAHPEKINAVGSFNVNTVSDKDYIASRTAFQLNLKGPAVGIFSACSTSLLAIADATESIRNNHCDVAIAGGVSITSPINSGHLYQEGAMLSKDGHCAPFDANSTGTTFSDGAGAILLKSLDKAIADGDFIYGVIKGIGVNNDGGGKGSFTAPSAEGQANTIAMAIHDANINPSEISYIEAHGTATPIGDPIEFEGLSLAFGEQTKTQYCAIGSVKSNFGHLTHAAGIAGIIKTALALTHKQIPASINFKTQNPQINFTESPFFVNKELTKWTNERKIAGVSSFGVGGTNVHLILEAYELEEQKVETNQPVLVAWSAKTKESNRVYAEKLSQFALNKDIQTPAIAATLRHTREDFAYRSFVIVNDNQQLVSQLTVQRESSQELLETKKDITFLFPGQGAQYAQMGKALYQHYPIFKAALDECTILIEQQLGENFIDLLFADEQNSKLQQTQYTQPALFAISYSLAKLLEDFGIKPTSYIGHSIGEFVAAHFAGIFSLKDVIKLIVQRARIVSELPNGSMLSVKTTLADIVDLVPPSLSIAAVNAKQSIVVAGPTNEIEQFAAELGEKGIASKTLKTSHAFHSAMMEDALEPFAKALDGIELHVPKIPILSTVTGQWLKDSEALDVNYWVNHLRKTVNFSGAIENLISTENTLLLEVGSGAALSAFAKQNGATTALSGLKNPKNEEEELHNFLNILGQLWLNGKDIEWNKLYPNTTKKVLSLPNYAYQKKRFWLTPKVQTLPLTANNLLQVPEVQIDTSFSEEPSLLNRIKEILERASGIELAQANPDYNFVELGLDSLLLTQVAINLKKEFDVPITFRQLNTDINSLNLLSAYLEKNQPQQEHVALGQAVSFNSTPRNLVLELSDEETKELKKPFGATPKIEKSVTKLHTEQQAFIDGFIKKYVEKTKASKQFTQENRAHMADPRVVSGFKPATKEIIYPIVISKSKGAKLWDLDNNEYVDALNGFGSNLLGNQPEILTNAIKAQIDKGYEIGPQHELAGEVTRLLCEFTNFDRAALCNTGSEAVLGAMRIARTTSGKSIIVSFSGSYHGINDEVLIRGTKKLKSFPAASGIMPEAVQNMLVLEYGSDESLEIIRQRSHEIAAVLVEPVQSRRPEFQPVEYLKKLRKLTEEQEVILIFDEVITGFRSHPGGAQALFGVKADLGTYGKVIGGGLPVGAIAGHRKYMDALDGGFWQFGDDSMPEIGVTYFAGTFVRHPMALAAAKASLLHFKAEGPALQEKLNEHTKYLAQQMNQICNRYSIPVFVAHFSSLWKIKFKEDYTYYELIFALMREKGVHILDGFPCFLTTAHLQKDIDFIITTFEACVAELVSVKLIPQHRNQFDLHFLSSENPPVNGAKLGLDEDGNAAWFIADDKEPENYLKIELN